MNFKTLINACDDNELTTILDAVWIMNKRLLSKFVQSKPELMEPSAEPPEEEETTPMDEMTDEEEKTLQDMTYEVIKSLGTDANEPGASLEDVITELQSLDYTRENVLDAIGKLLDLGNLYEPEIGYIKAVNI